jgi:hypothetical protein
MYQENNKLRILFIGNSHTYYNDMPELVASRARKCGYNCEVTMIAHPGWFLEQHTKEPDVRFNIRYGHYDYVVLQEHAHPFGPEEKFFSAVRILDGWIRESGARTVIYSTWARREEEFNQKQMNEAHRKIADEIGAILAPVGENWWTYKRTYPNLEMYDTDGAHASEFGSDFAAKYIWESVYTDIRRAYLFGDKGVE